MTSTSRLEFTIETFTAARTPPYTAVSYVWGQGASSQTIYLNGQEFAVRQNLWSCLHYLVQLHRNAGYRHEWHHLWVDAICINQSDGNEKSEQVRAMNKIFSRAVEVNAWLGLQRLPGQLQWKEGAVRTADLEDWSFDENMLDIAERPYWTRMWIVQELLLARRIRLHMSGASFDFDDFAQCVKNEPDSATEDLRRVLAYVNSRENNVLGSSESLLDLLLKFGACQCQDPKDNVFAIMSLVNNQDRQFLDTIFPDYSLTHEAVVVITLSYLREVCQQQVSTESSELFESLGVSPSIAVRRRLVTASKNFSVLDDLEDSKAWSFLPVPFDFEQEESNDTLTEIERQHPSSGHAISWFQWLFTCCGLFQPRRDRWEQALLDAMAQFEHQAHDAQRPWA